MYMVKHVNIIYNNLPKMQTSLTFLQGFHEKIHLYMYIPQ